jgi:hypothetical protein
MPPKRNDWKENNSDFVPAADECPDAVRTNPVPVIRHSDTKPVI